MTKAWLSILLVFAGCSGCTPGFEVRGQAQAEAIVWYGIYGQTEAPPRVEWITEGLTCADGRGFPSPRQDVCVAGLYWSDTNVAQVALPFPDMPIYATAYVHEFYHAALHRSGTPDPNHVTLGWQSGGVVEKAQNALMENDL